MRKYLYYILIFIYVPIQMKAQQANTPIETLVNKIQENIKLNSKEKFLIQTNRMYYDVGDTIWFSVSVADSFTGKPIRKSKQLFVDLVSNNDIVIQQLLLRGDTYKSEGTIKLNENLVSGIYWIRSFTKYTIDNNLINLSIYPIFINNKNRKLDSTLLSFSEVKKLDVGTPVIELFPEGGHIISGISSKVAVKVKDSNGTPLIVNGYIFDNKNDTISRFLTNKSGLAKFEFSPFPRKKYHISVRQDNGLNVKGDIPEIDMYTAQIAVTKQTDERIRVRVLLEDSLYTKEYQTILICMNRDSVCFASIGKGLYELEIPTRDLPGGELSLLLYNDKMELLSQRNCYINKQNAILKINTDKINYSSREIVKADIIVTDYEGKPLLADMSISVLDNQYFDSAFSKSEDTLKTFSTEEKDLVMLTSNYKNSLWKTDYQFDLYEGNKYLLDTIHLSGQLVSKNYEKISNQHVTLLSKELASFALEETTDKKGRFNFTLPDFIENTEFQIQVKNENGIKKDFHIIIDSFLFPSFVTPISKKNTYQSQISLLINRHEKISQAIFGKPVENILSPVVVNNNLTKGKIKLNTGYLITKEMLAENSNVLNAVLTSGKFHLLKGQLVTGIMGGANGLPTPTTPNDKSNSGNKANATSTETIQPNITSRNDEPILIIDGAENPLSSSENGNSSPLISYLSMLQPEGIDHIILLSDIESGKYGLRGGRGAIEIYYTPTGPSVVSNLTNGLLIIRPKGYHVAIPFAIPDYSNHKIKQSKNSDNRFPIFWSSNILTDKNGKANFNFYTSDGPTSYRIIINGITSKGYDISKTVNINRQ